MRFHFAGPGGQRYYSDNSSPYKPPRHPRLSICCSLLHLLLSPQPTMSLPRSCASCPGARATVCERVRPALWPVLRAVWCGILVCARRAKAATTIGRGQGPNPNANRWPETQIRNRARATTKRGWGSTRTRTGRPYLRHYPGDAYNNVYVHTCMHTCMHAYI
jgi:hypothetical protein